MPAKLKVSDEQIKKIRRRVRAGARLIDLADEFGVNRKTLWRRLSALERAESERAQTIAANRLRRQAAREKRKLLEREREAGIVPPIASGRSSGRPGYERSRAASPHFEWLERPKNLSGRALSESAGFVRVRTPDGAIRKGVEREEVEALLDAGWLLDETFWSDSKRRRSPRPRSVPDVGEGE
jgi:hypothetical protein